MALHTFRFLAWTVLLLLAPTSTVQQTTKDPLNDFCRRFDQQTAVIDSRLYIDGGLVNWSPISSNPGNFTNQNLLWDDLNNDSKDGMPQLHDDVTTKNSTIPSVAAGILWEDSVNKYFYQFGGYFPQLSPTDFSVWAYDTVNNYWKAVSGIPNTFARVAHGAGTTVSARGEGYYLGGYQDNTTTPGWSGRRQYTSTLIKYDFTSGNMNNITGPDIGRGEGVMVYIPASDSGLLVFFGGVTQSPVNGSLSAVPMSQIGIYDIVSSNWYTQQASGDIPEDRMRFCAGATWAQDKSSYNIYLYGGLSPNGSNVAFDDIYILTLPAFVWIKWWPPTPGPGRGHHSMTCNVINGAQMIVMGGTFPDDDQCDAQTVWGEHSMNLGKNDPTNSQWSAFIPSLKTYNVPSEISNVTGGTATGGATVKSPVQGSWNNRDLSVYFSRTASAAAITPTRAVPTPSSASTKAGKKVNAGVIAGATVGGVVLLMLVALMACLCCRRRRRSKQNASMLPTKETYETPSPPQRIVVPEHPPAELATSPTITSNEYGYFHRKDPSVSASEIGTPNSPPPHSIRANSHPSSNHTASPPLPSVGMYPVNQSRQPRSPEADDIIRPEQFYNTGQHSPAHHQTSFDRRSPASYGGSSGQGYFLSSEHAQGSADYGHISPGSSLSGQGQGLGYVEPHQSSQVYGSPERTFAAPIPQSATASQPAYADRVRGSFSQTPSQFYPPPPPPGTVQQSIAEEPPEKS